MPRLLGKTSKVHFTCSLHSINIAQWIDFRGTGEQNSESNLNEISSMQRARSGRQCLPDYVNQVSCWLSIKTATSLAESAETKRDPRTR